MKNKIIAMAAALFACATPAWADIDDRLEELKAQYLGAEPQSAAVAALSMTRESALDEAAAIRSGDWISLSRKYRIAFISDDIREVPSPERISYWWSSLGDETLTDLIYRALAKNRTIASAQAKLSEARAALGISKSALLPWIDGSGVWSNADSSENTDRAGASYNLFKLGIDAAWEIDIFGGRRAAVKASEADLAAAYLQLHATWVSLASEVALNYVDLCALHERFRIANENLRIQNETHDLLQSQVDSGLADELALSQATYTLEQTRASIPPIMASIESTMNTLSILVGETPGSLSEMLRVPRPIPSPDPINLIGIPANTLRRRPDIAAAEYTLIAQQARTESARAELYPRFSLVGSIGLESFSTGTLFKGSSFGFAFGPSISWPIFHGGAIRRNIKVQTAREEQLLAAYEQTVLSAVAEVRNALTVHEQLTARSQMLRSGVDAARSALEIARDKYSNGLADFNNVIGAQAALLSLQDQEITNKGTIASSIIQLFKALGGGWAPMDEALAEAAKSDKR